MALHRILFSLLLLELAVTSLAHTQPCYFSEDKTRCVCNVRVMQTPEDFNCCVAPELELRDGKLESFQMNIPSILDLASVFRFKKLIFNNVIISSSFFSLMVLILPQTALNEINIISSTIDVVQPVPPPTASKMRTLQLENITVNSDLLQPQFQPLHHWLFGSLTSFGLICSHLVEFDCYWAHKTENLTLLDLSDNPISLTSLQDISRCPSLSYKNLKSLHLGNSNLTSLQPLCTVLNLTTALTDLDVSRNNFSIFHFPHCLQVKPLRTLNISHSKIREVNLFHSVSLEELDLSYNSLEVFRNPPQTLKRLNLSNNHLINLNFLGNLSYLKELNVDGNQLTALTDESQVVLRTLQQLDVLHAAINSYRCDCAFRETFLLLNRTKDPHKILCATPEAQRGTPITKYSFETCKTNKQGMATQIFSL